MSRGQQKRRLQRSCSGSCCDAEQGSTVAALLVDDPAAELGSDNLGRLLGEILDLPAQLFVTAPAYKLEKKAATVRPGTLRVQVLADGKLCSETVASARLFPDAARAMAEYRAALAYTQWATYLSTPAELRQDCDLVQHVRETGLALAYGLPIEERDYAGRVRRYAGGEKRALKPALFRLPKGYAVLELPGLEEDGTGSSSQPPAVQAR